MNNIRLNYRNYINYGVDLNEEDLNRCLQWCKHEVRHLEKRMLELASEGRFGAAKEVAHDLEIEKLMLEELRKEVTQI